VNLPSALARPPLAPHTLRDRFCASDRGLPPSSVGLRIDRVATSPPPPHPQRTATSPPPSRRNLTSANASRPRLRHRRRWRSQTLPPFVAASSIRSNLGLPRPSAFHLAFRLPPRRHLCCVPRIRPHLQIATKSTRPPYRIATASPRRCPPPNQIATAPIRSD
jgi:hypothetical protein